MTHPVAITGMHRSGTSMITRALHDAGLALVGTSADELKDAADDNPEGFWENKGLVEVNDSLLEAGGGAWDHPPELVPQSVDDPRVAHLADAATAALAPLRQHERWGFKDPRTCLTAAYWLDLEPELRFVLCIRHPIEVAQSLKRRNQSSYSLGLALWERYYSTLLELVPSERIIVTHYDTFFTDPVGEVERLCEFVDLEPTPPRVLDELRHHSTGIDLVDAGASASLRSLYAELCRAAGVTPPREAPADEGRVRRLILDGAVSARHAEQRQAAIELLREREAEFRAAHAAREAELRQQLQASETRRHQDRTKLETDHRSLVANLERQLADARAEATERVEAMHQATSASLESLQAAVQSIDARATRTAQLVEVAIGELQPGPVRRQARRWAGRLRRRGSLYVAQPARRAARVGRARLTPAARSAAARLPDPVQHQLKRTRVLLRRFESKPAATAKAIATKASRTARIQARRLPAPAQRGLRTTEARARRVVDDPTGAARSALPRLPGPVRVRVERGARSVRDALRSAAVSRPDPEVPRVAPPPKGPAPRLWRDDYTRLVAAAWPGEEPWLVTVPGSPAEVAAARRTRGTPFPTTPDGRPMIDDLSHIAQLEAKRYAGHRHLAVPEGSRGWFSGQTELRNHVVGTYRLLADGAGGLTFDLGEPAEATATSLRSTVERLAGAGSPAVLDLTELDIARELPDLAVFGPPKGSHLPYLDNSIDLVVTDADTAHEGEARRVASQGVITVRRTGTGLDVVRADALPGARPSVAGASPPVRCIVWSSPDGGARWTDALTERARADGAAVHISDLTWSERPDLTEHDVVVLVEPGSLPLPSALRTAAALADEHPDGAIVGRVLRADGTLEAAGATVFLDRSVALVAAGSTHVRAPWHDYVRSVCWAPGLIAASAATLGASPPPLTGTARATLREWCADLWASGRVVRYHPSVNTVRVFGDGAEPSTPLSESRWQRVLDLRPPRPSKLGDGEWRYLLAHDDVEACRG